MLKLSVYEAACADLTALLTTRPLTELHGMRIFATGCTGFFGFWLLAAIACLNRQGARIEVVALSRNPNDFLRRHPVFANASWLSFISATIRDFRLEAPRFDAVIHAATDTSPAAAAKPEQLLADITDGTGNLLTQVAAAGYQRFLLVSSGAVYGEQAPTVDTLCETAALAVDALPVADVYARGKLGAEMQCAAVANFSLPAPVIARCFAFVGPCLPTHLAPAQFVRALINDGNIMLQGDGTSLRSYLDAADLALWLLTLLARGKPGCAYNVGGAKAISMAELAATIRDVLRPEANLTILGTSSHSPRQRYLPDISRARDELHLASWTPLTHSIVRMAHAIEHQQ